MGSSTDLYLPLHVRTHDLVMVLAKIMGEPYVLTSFDKDEVVSYRPYRTKKVPTPFDPSEPGTQASALASANALAAFVASVIANDQPHLPHTYIMRQEHLDLIEGVLKNG